MVNEQVTTIELTAGTPSTVEFSGAYPYYWVDNKSDSEVYASLGTPEAGTDGTYTIAAGSQLRISGGAFNTKLCLLGSGKVQVIASSIASCPFKQAQGGGGCAVAGASYYTLNDAVDYPLLGLNLYGKSTQDGTPTPENPVDIVSVGDSGSVGITACGKNMYEGSQDWSGTWINSGRWETSNETYIGLPVKKRNGAWSGISKYIYVEAGKTYNFSCFAKADTETTAQIYVNEPSDAKASAIPRSKWARCNISTKWTRYDISYTCEKSGLVRPRIEKTTADDNYMYICGFQFEVNDTATDYEPYKGNTASITSALPLCGIPVSEGGNYTDSNGQQWICDELIYNADGTGKIFKHTAKIDSYSSESIATPYISTTGNLTTGATVIYQLAKPQEIELTAAEMAALRELQTYSGVTNITNGSSADMDVKICTNKMLAEYVKPITTGLQKQIDELKAAVLSLGGNV